MNITNLKANRSQCEMIECATSVWNFCFFVFHSIHTQFECSNKYLKIWYYFDPQKQATAANVNDIFDHMHFICLLACLLARNLSSFVGYVSNSIRSNNIHVVLTRNRSFSKVHICQMANRLSFQAFSWQAGSGMSSISNSIELFRYNSWDFYPNFQSEGKIICF